MIPMRAVPSLLAVVLAAAVVQAQPAGPPDAEVRRHVDAFVEAFRGGRAEAYETMAQAHFSPALLARATPADRRAMFERLRTDFGAITVGPIRIVNDVASFPVRGATGFAARIELSLEPAPPFRIVRVAVEVGGDGPAERDAPPIPLAPAMSAAEMTRLLDDALTPRVGRDAFAGVVLIARDGVPVVQRAYGLADREAGVAASLETRFSLGSLDKLFTKVAIGQLLQAGRLALTDTVGSLLPDFPDTAARRATVDQLLNHRGGLADFFGPAFDAAAKDRFRTNADYYRLVAGQPVRFEPGARQEYCNGCYIVLGAIIERVSGMPYESYVAKHVFGPAGMKGAGGMPSAAGATPASAIGYTRRPAPGRPADGPLQRNTMHHGAAGSAAGGGYATAADLLAFDNALRRGALLDPARTAWMLQSEPDSGPATGRAGGAIGASGGAPGVNAALEADGTWTIVVLANLDPPAAIGVASAIRRALTPSR